MTGTLDPLLATAIAAFFGAVRRQFWLRPDALRALASTKTAAERPTSE